VIPPPTRWGGARGSFSVGESFPREDNYCRGSWSPGFAAMRRMRKGRCGVSLDWQSGELAEGLGCYRRREFFVAHEHWELVWLRLHEPEKSFVQAIVQITAAFHHWQQGNAAGTLSLLLRAQSRLAAYPASFGGIAVEPLRTEIEAWLRGIESGNLPTTYPATFTDGS